MPGMDTLVKRTVRVASGRRQHHGGALGPHRGRAGHVVGLFLHGHRRDSVPLPRHGANASVHTVSSFCALMFAPTAAMISCWMHLHRCGWYMHAKDAGVWCRAGMT